VEVRTLAGQRLSTFCRLLKPESSAGGTAGAAMHPKTTDPIDRPNQLENQTALVTHILHARWRAGHCGANFRNF
jgi:hypothetical protein